MVFPSAVFPQVWKELWITIAFWLDFRCQKSCSRFFISDEPAEVWLEIAANMSLFGQFRNEILVNNLGDNLGSERN